MILHLAPSDLSANEPTYTACAVCGLRVHNHCFALCLAPIKRLQVMNYEMGFVVVVRLLLLLLLLVLS